MTELNVANDDVIELEVDGKVLLPPLYDGGIE